MVASVSLLFYVVTWLEISVAKLSVTLWYLINLFTFLHCYISESAASSNSYFIAIKCLVVVVVVNGVLVLNMK